MNNETKEERSSRILSELHSKYPAAAAYDLDGRGLHFLAEVEPVKDHSEYDKAVEVIISSLPHKHLKMTQWYTVLKGILTFHIGDEVKIYQAGDKFKVEPGTVHWATNERECWVEIYSRPGWTKEDHIVVPQ